MVESFKRLQRKALIAMHRDYDRTFSTEHGKRVLADIVDVGRVGLTTHVAGDTHATAFNEGARSVALRIMNQAGVGVVDIHKVLKELQTDE